MQEKNMIFLKKKHVIPKQGGGGGAPHLGKIPTFSRFFFWERPLFFHPDPSVFDAGLFCYFSILHTALHWIK